jgi:Carboxypeptidase regulatory-like domain
MSREDSCPRSPRVTVWALACVLLVVLGVLVLGVVAAPKASASPDRKDKSVGRLLYGKVLDPQDNPLPDAVVYLTNSRTRAVKTYIVGSDGTYRFPALSAAIDYEVYAQYKGRKSETKSVSQFDDRSQVYIDLRIDTR